MPTNKLILYYLDKITNQDALEFCRRNNWDFSNEEISLILKFARKYRFYINVESKNYLLSEFKKWQMTPLLIRLMKFIINSFRNFLSN